MQNSDKDNKRQVVEVHNHFHFDELFDSSKNDESKPNPNSDDKHNNQQQNDRHGNDTYLGIIAVLAVIIVMLVMGMR